MQALMERAPDSVTTHGITRSGFMQLQAMMIQQQRLDICWNMLRSFGYNRHLHLEAAVYESIPEAPGSQVCFPPESSELSIITHRQHHYIIMYMTLSFNFFSYSFK